MLYGVTASPIELLDLAPTIVSTAFTDNEGATAVGSVVATDPDLGDVVTFAIVGGADAALFSIDAATGALSFLSAPSYATPADADSDNIYELTIEASDSVLTTSQAITVTVAKVVALSGVSSAFSAGILLASPRPPLVGVAEILSAGILAARPAIALPGNGLVMAAGTFNLVSVNPPGAAMTAAAGTIAGSIADTLTGTAATLSAGAFSFPQPYFDSGSAHNVTLSNANLTVTNTGTTSTDQGAKALDPKTSSDGVYFEATITTRNGGGNVGFGCGTDASTYANMGNDATSGAMVFVNSGNMYVNGSFKVTLNGLGLLQGTTSCIAYKNGNVWIRYQNGNWNGSPTADPATNTGGYALPAGAMEPFAVFGGSSGASGNAITFNFGGSAFAYTVPSGFSGPNP